MSKQIGIGDTVLACRTKDDFKNSNFDTKVIIVSEPNEFVWRVRMAEWEDGVTVPIPKTFVKEAK